MDSNKEREDTDPPTTNGFDKILCLSKEMIPCKLVFFIFEMAQACGGHLLSLFYIESGLTVYHLGKLIFYFYISISERT